MKSGRRTEIRASAIILALAIVAVAVLSYVLLVPRPNAVATGTVVATPQPSAPPMDKKLLLRRAMAGDAEAQCRLSGRFMDGINGLPEDPKLALYWASLSAAQHNPCGLNNLGALYHRGEGVPLDYAVALGLTRAAASLGDANAMFNLGLDYYYGDGVPSNVFTAIDWYTKAGNLGLFDALKQLGVIYGWGDGVPINVNRASAYLLRANPVHDPEAASDLGSLYYNYYRRSDRCAKMIYWFKLAKGDAYAEYMLGRFSLFGQCVGKDGREAVKWFKAAMAGDVRAETAYAVILWDGLAGPPNRREALRYFELAADRGDGDALRQLAFFSEHGMEVPRNADRAWQLYMAAAARGQLDSIYVVANAYLEGTRVKKDKVKALGLVLGAIALGGKPIARDVDGVRRSLTPSELAAAKAFAFAFSSKMRQRSPMFSELRPPLDATQPRVN